MAPTPTSSSGGGASLTYALRLLVQLQLAARLSTFLLNQLLVRLTSPAVFGAASIQLELLLGVVLSAARDGVRAASLRSQPTDHSSGSSSLAAAAAARQLVHNLSFLSVAAGLVLAPTAAWIYVTRLAPTSLAASPYLVTSVGLYLAGGALELLAEPLFNHAQAAGNVGLRVRAEGASLVINCITILVAIVRPRWVLIPLFNTKDPYEYALVAYGLGRAMMGLTTLVVYVGSYWALGGLSSVRAVVAPQYAQPTQDAAPRLLSGSGLRLVWALSQQALLKYVLGELDKLAVARLGSLEDQGGYALASNYGSLVARILFFPVEEAGRIQFARELGGLLDSGDKSHEESNKPSDDQLSQTLNASSNQLAEILRLLALLGAFFCTFGPPLAPWALWILAGRGWACGPASVAGFQLGVYALYVPAMGLNGSAEGFLTATASPRLLRSYSLVLALSSAVFVAVLFASHTVEGTVSAYLFSAPDSLAHARYASATLTLAAIAATLTRGIACLAYIRWFFRSVAPTSVSTYSQRFALNRLLPPLPTLATFVAAAAILRVALPQPAYSSLPTRPTWLAKFIGTQYPGAAPPNTCPQTLLDVVPPVGLGAVLAVICLAVCFFTGTFPLPSTLRRRSA